MRAVLTDGSLIFFFHRFAHNLKMCAKNLGHIFKSVIFVTGVAGNAIYNIIYYNNNFNKNPLKNDNTFSQNLTILRLF